MTQGGNVSRDEPEDFKDALDFDDPMPDYDEKGKLENLFKEFIVPFSN